jgi:septal ring-binding cell division protein DamX
MPPAGDPGRFTLQLLASRDRQAVREIAGNHSEARHMWLYSFLRDGQRWYALCYGVHTDRGAADSAAARLSREGRFSNPWVRRLGDIQALPGVSAVGNP